jgi:hypothetical protein
MFAPVTGEKLENDPGALIVDCCRRAVDRVAICLPVGGHLAEVVIKGAVLLNHDHHVIHYCDSLLRSPPGPGLGVGGGGVVGVGPLPLPAEPPQLVINTANATLERREVNLERIC